MIDFKLVVKLYDPVSGLYGNGCKKNKKMEGIFS